jgi:PPK2 family polyphosphate:nucleotide phosphotransferase
MGASSRGKEASRLARRFTVSKGGRFRLSEVDPDDTGGIDSKDHAAALLAEGVNRLRLEQEKLYAQGTWAILLIFQAMDAAGKDSTIKHVMSGVNPQGCQVFSFKAPSSEELAHDFLWRTTRCLPERGRIGIFNRSYYEEVLVVKVHEEWLERQRLPNKKYDEKFWQHRYDDINAFEHHLTRNGTVVLKFFLNISKREQRKRFLDRLANPKKHWKFSAADLAERQYWNEYMDAYGEAFTATSTRWAPWYVIPADYKWAARTLIADIVATTIESLDLRYPKVTKAERKELDKARHQLESE